MQRRYSFDAVEEYEGLPVVPAVPVSDAGEPSSIAEVLPASSPETSWITILCPLELGNRAVITGAIPMSPVGTSRPYNQTEPFVVDAADPSSVQLLVATSLTLVGVSDQSLPTTAIILLLELALLPNVAVTERPKKLAP